MLHWREITHGFRALWNRESTDKEIADEVRDFVERSAAQHRDEGLSTGAAYRAARIELGGNVAEEVRGYGWENLVETLFADLRYAFRWLRTSPGFTAVAVLTLAVGIGSTTAIFSVVNPILFQPLPYPDPARIAMVWEVGTGRSKLDGTFGTLRELSDRSRSFQALAAVKPWQPTLVGSAEPELLGGQSVSAGFLTVLGVPPRLGRDFQASEDVSNGPLVVILSDGLWRRRFGGDPNIVGRTISLNDSPYLVIGVMPKDFESVLDPSAEVWRPLQYDISEGRAWGHHLRMVGRVKSGVAFEEATQELQLIAANPVAEFPRPAWADLAAGVIVNSLQDDVTEGVRPALLLILAAVGLVLVIACVNVTNLLLARGVNRRAEFALRAALGADQPRLVRQLLTECLLLSAIGGLLGMGVAGFGVSGLVALSPPGLPRLSAVGVDRSVFVFGLAITTLIGIGFGLIPAFQAARSDPREYLQAGARQTSGQHRRLRSALVVAEVSLALVLLVGAGLMLRSLKRVFAVDAGFDSSQVLTMQVLISGHRFDADSAAHRFYAQALDAVRQVPGVVSAGLTSQLPLSGDDESYGAFFEPNVAGDPDDQQSPYRYAVAGGYFDAMRIPLKRGRLLNDRDTKDALPVALISESMARRRLPGLEPIGQRMKIGSGPVYTVVGVVGDVRQVSLALNDPDAVYTTDDQWAWADRAMSLVVRTRGDAAGLAQAVRKAVWSVDRDQAISRVSTLESVVAASAAERRFALLLLEVFALAALVLSAAGIYGVLSGSVAERTREIGVRSALGASRGSILSLVVGQGMSLTGLGVVIGLAGALFASQVMIAMLFGVSHLDPLTYVVAMGVLAGVSIVACSIPAWRAVQVDPAITLRTE